MAREASGCPGTGRTYLCIDLKTFYASVECADRGLDPFTTNLVVADPSRGNTTICLAITPAMKALGVRNRCRVFEIPPGIDYITAVPRMRHYMEVSAKIYATYLEFVAPEDIHPYSIDECFIDATPYLDLYDIDARTLADRLRDAVHDRFGICATVGIGPNLFLAKVALDITAKHVPDGIGELDSERFRREIWTHRPITDIWGIGPGIARRLAAMGAQDLMGVAALDEEVLYREFGVNAEYLIDHAFGIEPVTIADIRAYRPAETSYVNGQILPADYTAADAHLVMREMVDAAAMELVDRREVAGRISLYVGYAGDGADTETGARGAGGVFRGEHGTRVRRERAHGGAVRKLSGYTASRAALLREFRKLWDEVVDPARMIRRINVGLGDLRPEEFATVTLFTDVEGERREGDLARAVIAVKGKFGKNALVRGISLTDKATARERNEQIGGHRA